MKRIIVIGPPGAGKSTFSRKLSEVLHLPLYHLDNIFWRSDKTHLPKEEFKGIVESLLEEDQWIMDGDYSSTLEMRMNKSDTVFFLNYPQEVCLEGIRSRIGKKREDIPFLEEEIDPEFMEWAKNWEKNKLPIVLQLIEKYSNEKNIIVFTSRIEADAYLSSLK